MAVVEVISKLDALPLSEKQEQYSTIAKLLSDGTNSVYEGLNKEHLKDLCKIILNDIENETSELSQAVKLLHCLIQNKNLQKIFLDEDKVEVVKSVINIIDFSRHENVLVNCFSILIQITPSLDMDTVVLENLLQKMVDVLSKKSESVSAYFIVCSYFQKVLKDYESKLSNFTPVLSQLVFLPLCHPSTKVREVAEKNLDMSPKFLLYSPDEVDSTALLKLVKETYCKDLLLLFKDKHELYVLKVWKHVIIALGSALPSNLPVITPLFQVIERGFKSSVDEVVMQSFDAWKSIISCFASTEGLINDSKKLRFILKPFKNIARSSESILCAACDSWWYIAWSLSNHLSSRFTEVCIPLIELTVGKITNGYPEKFPKGGPVSLLKKCCYILLRFLEQPNCDSFNEILSPKKLPNIPYPALQVPVEMKVITHHFKEILCAFRILIDAGGTNDDMKQYLECLMKFVLYIVSTLVEDSNKESVEAVIAFLTFLTDIIEANVYPAPLCLKCLESLSKFSRKVLVSHHFNCGSRTSQDILCISLLKLLFNPHVFPNEFLKRFSEAYNRLVQAGMHESFYPLQITQKFLHVIRTSIGTRNVDTEAIIDVWSGIATPLLEIIEKTQEVNQGDKQEHDFGCMYDILIFPFEFIFPFYINQLRTRPVLRLWTSLYKAFIRSAALVPTTSTNEACENFCLKLKIILKEDTMKKPHFFESACLFLQIVIESVDFAVGNASGAQGIIDVAFMVKRKKPLANLTSFVDILSLLLKIYYTHFIEDDDSNQANAPSAQRKLNIVKNAAPLDLVKSFFGSIKSGGIISFIMEQLADPLSKLFLKSSQKRNLVNHVDAKLEIMWNVVTSTIERYYLGPYDSEFLTVLSPLLEATFSHPKRNLKERSRRFWFATFGPNASSLKFPESLKNVLKKIKLPLLPDDMISPTEFSVSPLTDSVPEDSIDVNPPALLHSMLTKAATVKSVPVPNGEVPKVVMKENKPATKFSIDDLPNEEFVKIDSSVPNAFKRRSIRKRKSFVPTLYNDLSQDLSNMQSSMDSQDTTNSASLEEPEFKELLVDNAKMAGKDVNNSIINNKDVAGIFIIPSKSSMSAKFEESLDKNLSEKTTNINKNIIESCNNHSEEDKNSKKPKLDVEQNEKKSFNDELIEGKMSVFSIHGEKKTLPRSTRRNTRLSQSFSAVCDKKTVQNKLEIQKLNKSCIELIHLNDSEEIIPSSQSSSENEVSVKLAIIGNANEAPDVQQILSEVSSKTASEKSLVSCALRNTEDIEKSIEEFADDNAEVKRLLTSTPSKIKLAAAADNDIDESSFVENMNKDDPEIELVLCTKESDDKHAELHGKNEVVTKLENIPKEVNISPMDIEECEKHVKEMNDLPDAMEDEEIFSLNDDSPEISETLYADLQMKDVFVTDVKDAASVPFNVEKGQSSGKEILVKIPRRSLKQVDNDLPKESYSQKLRKKASCMVSIPQIKIRKRKNLKVSNKEMEDASESDKSNVFIPEKLLNVVPNSQNLIAKDSSKETEDVLKETKNIVKPEILQNIAPCSENVPLVGKHETCNDKGRRKTEKRLIFGKSKKKKTESDVHEKDSQNAEITPEESDSSVESCLVVSHVQETIENQEKVDPEEDKIKKYEESNKVDDIIILKENTMANSPSVNKTSSKSNKNGTRRKSLRQSTLRSDKSKDTILVETNSQDLEVANKSNTCKVVSLNPLIKDDDLMSTANKVPAVNCLSKKTVNSDQNFDTSESCEIFDTCSQNSCRELHDDEQPSTGFGQFGKPVAILDSVPEIKHSLFSSKDVSKKGVGTNIVSDQDKNEENVVKNTMIIPSSLENDDSSKMSLEFKTSNDISSVFLSSTSLVDKITKENTDSIKDNICAQFSDTEDDLDDQIHGLVKSIVEASSNNESNDYSEQEKNSAVSRLQFVFSCPPDTVNSSTDIDNKSNPSKIQDDEISTFKNSVEEISSQPSQSSGLILSNSDSSVSNSSDAVEFILENSEEREVDSINKVDITVENNYKNKLKGDFNLCIPLGKNPNDSFNSSKNNNLISHVEHSYSIKNQIETDLDASSNVNKSVVSESEDCQLLHETKTMGIETGFIDISELNTEIYKSSQVKLHSVKNDSDKVNFLKIPETISIINSTDSTYEAEVTSKETGFISANQIECIVKELVVQVDNVEYNYDSIINERDDLDSVFCANQNHDLASSKTNINNLADKENQVFPLSDAEKLTKGSKKRKNKAPIRTPLNFKQRSKLDGPKKSLTKVAKTVNHPQNKLVPHLKDVVITNVLPNSDSQLDHGNNSENSMTKIISSIVDSVTENEINVDPEMLSSFPCSSQMSSAQKIELSNDELTDLNTRLNASIAPQTRRSKLIAATQSKIPCENESDVTHSDIVIVCSEDSTKNLSSILKKRKSSLPLPPAKVRKVTFASPLIQELVFETYTETNQVESVNMCSIQNLAKKRKKILQEKNKPEKTVAIQSHSESEDVPSSSEYQDSDVFDFCDLSVSPAFVNCPGSISSIIRDLTSPSWVRGLESLLISKNIKTVGDVCKLNIHQLKAMPFKSPKVRTLHKALMTYLNQTQESVLENFKAIDDESVETEIPASSSEVSKSTDTGITESNDESILLEETVKNLLESDALKELPLSLLGQLVEACGKAISERNRHS